MEQATDTGAPTVGGRYGLIEVIGRGGSSVVWRAYDAELERQIAVKVLAHNVASDPSLRKRFHREARHVASLIHPNIATVYDFGTDGDRSFIVMEYVGGQSLRHILKSSGSVPVAGTASAAVDALSALGHAHDRGIIHRDVKPGNILVTTAGVVKVVDFGVAKSLNETTEFTVLGSFIGTARYAAPEQFTGGRISPASDLYSLGCVLYHCLSGHPPFEADDVEKLILQHRFAEPESIDDPRVPPSMKTAIMVSLEKDPEKRWASASAMCDGFTQHVGTELDWVGVITQAGEEVESLLPADREPGGLWSHTLALGSNTTTRGSSKGDATPDLPHAQQANRVRKHRYAIWLAVALAAIGIVVGAAFTWQSGRSTTGTGRAQSQLPSGGYLQPGQFLLSPNHRFALVMQSDGNLVDYADSRTVALWESGTSGNFGSYVVMQPDGDLVVYPHGKSAPSPGESTSALWSSGSFGHVGSYLEVGSNGDLFVKDSHRGIVWEFTAAAS